MADNDILIRLLQQYIDEAIAGKQASSPNIGLPYSQSKEEEFLRFLAAHFRETGQVFDRSTLNPITNRIVITPKKKNQ